MTRYQKHMNRIHSIGATMTIEGAVINLIEDIVDHLIYSGVKSDSPLINDIRNLSKCKYEPEKLKNHE
jgi:hypothetical protein